MYWVIQCPHCHGANYWKVVNHKDTNVRWPILRCKCGKYHTKMESELAIHLFCDAIPTEEVTELVKRQAIRIELEKIGI